MTAPDPDENKPDAPDVFISYVSADLARAELLYVRLQEAGFAVWFDKARLRPGCRWHQEIEAGCEAARVMVPLITPRWQASEWTRFETYAHDDIIPVLAEGKAEDVMPPPLRGPQGVTFDPLVPDETAWVKLVAEIRTKLAAPVPTRADRVIKLPYMPNAFFTGREKEINQIHEALHTAPAAALTQGKVQAVAAMGGMGKTTLASEYAHRHWRCYRQIFWVNARIGLDMEFARLCETLFPESTNAGLNLNEKVQRALAELGGAMVRLLVIDNVEDSESVRPFLPRAAGSGCRTLITSRFADWPKAEGIGTIALYVLEPEPSREFLVHRSGQPAEGAELSACDDLARELGYLPLPLEQAAAYMAQAGGMRFSEYLRLYREIYEELLAEKVTGSTQYPDSVLVTWDATTKKLSPEARGILRLCAWYSDTLLPKSLILEGVDAVLGVAADFGVVAPAKGGAADEHRLTKALGDLARFSMILDFTQDNFRIHGLVQTVERVQAEKAGQDKPVKDRALTILNNAFPGGQAVPDLWPLCALLLPHLERLLAYPFPNDATDRVWELLTHGGSFLQHRGTALAALPQFERALEETERVFGREHPYTLVSVNNLASCLDALGDARAALPFFRRGVEERTRLLGEEHPFTLTSVDNLATCLLTLGQSPAALPLFRHALEARERVLGKEDPQTLNSFNNLASCLQTLGDVPAALPLFRHALEANERVRGTEHPETIRSVNNLAGCLQALGDVSTALPLFRHALETRERVLGKEHPDTLNSVNDLAACLFLRGDATAALPLYRRTLEAQERVLGTEHPRTLMSVNNLAECLRALGDATAALSLCERALQAQERLRGKEHPDTIRSVNNLACCLLALGDARAALPLFHRAAEAAARVLGKKHPLTKTIQKSYAIVLFETAQSRVKKWIPRLFGRQG